MIINSLKIYTITLLCCFFMIQAMRKGCVTYSFMENLYIWATKAVCKSLSELVKTTNDDVLELHNTASVLHIDGNMVTWNPIEGCIVPAEDIVVKYYLNRESLKRNISLNANKYVYDSSDSYFLWSPTNRTVVKLDKRKYKWVPLSEFLVIHYICEYKWRPVNEFLLHIDEQMLKWLPLDNIRTLIKGNTINSYSENEPQNEINFTTKKYPSSVKTNEKKTWHLINESYTNREDSFMREIGQIEDFRKNWYLFNESHVAIKRPNIDITRETKIIIHGFGGTATQTEVINIALVYEKLNLFNILLINVEASFNNHYIKCLKIAQLLSKAIAELIIHLVSFGAKAADFHLIGVSLGAHAAGWVGKHLRSEGHHIGRITGLDPAGPCFANMPRSERLDKTDASFVDVIHTNSLLEGLFEPLGHVDFYINGGGPFQPGCGFEMACSHMAAAVVHMESIRQPELFVAVKCDSWTQFQNKQCSNETVTLGNAFSSDTRGMYYLRISGERPYGLGIDGIVPEKT